MKGIWFVTERNMKGLLRINGWQREDVVCDGIYEIRS